MSLLEEAKDFVSSEPLLEIWKSAKKLRRTLETYEEVLETIPFDFDAKKALLNLKQIQFIQEVEEEP